jgi:hypothetical protein
MGQESSLTKRTFDFVLHVLGQLGQRCLGGWDSGWYTICLK